MPPCDLRPGTCRRARVKRAWRAERIDEVCRVGVSQVCHDEEEYLLLRGDVLVQVGARPAELPGNRGERDLVVGPRVELPAGGALYLTHALALLLGAPRAFELCHVAGPLR